MYPAASRSPADVERARSQTGTRLDWADRLAPEFMRIHPIAPDLPQECIAITAQVFMSIQFHTTHDVPSYQDWLEGASQRLGFDFHHRFLQHLQAKTTARMAGVPQMQELAAPARAGCSKRRDICSRSKVCSSAIPMRASSTLIAIRCASWLRWRATRRCCGARSATARIRSRSPPTGPTGGRERSTNFSRCAIARRRRSSSTSTSSRSRATRSAPSSASTIFSVGR